MDRLPLARRIAFVLAFAALLVAPFATMEAANTAGAQSEWSVVLFVFMFGHAVLIAAALGPAVVHVLHTRHLSRLGILHWSGVAVGLALLGIYVGVVVDQMPCFMGVPNCD